ncbi:MAG: hypothetical protein EOL91_01140 [Actinobacteria bacterium]|nr:hypothetical protein [Actinomycetota bacterium]
MKGIVPRTTDAPQPDGTFACDHGLVRLWFGGAEKASMRRRAGKGYTPRMPPVLLILPVWLVIASAGWWALNLWLRSRPDLVGQNPSAIEVTKIALTLATGIGAVFVGVYAYRKQRLEEGASARSDYDQFLGRYNAATEQLAHDKPAARLAGVYAMARLADDWPAQRQQGVDVLCAYLRMSPTDDHGDQEVRSSIVRVITDHLREPEKPTSWSSLSFNFEGARLVDANFRGVTFSGERTWFGGASFSGERAWFDGATFSGKRTWFGGASISANETSFVNTHFMADRTWFDRVSFTGRELSFNGATFGGERVWFDQATFGTAHISFEDTIFRADTSFNSIEFDGDLMTFNGAKFEGCTMTFNDPVVSARALIVGLDDARLEEGATITRNGKPLD